MDKNFRLTPQAAPEKCRPCPLFEHHWVTQQVPTEVRGKPGNIKVMFIAEAPGESEDREGRPVIGKTGLILRRVVKQITGSEDGVVYGNSVRCRPPKFDQEKRRVVDRAPSKVEVGHCRPNIMDDIDRVRPKYIVLLGASAARGLAVDPVTGKPIDPSIKMNQLRGKEFAVRTPRGNQYPAIIAYHFAAAARNALLGGIFREDVLKAFLRADGIDYSRRGKRCIILDTIPKIRKFLAKMAKGLTKDHVVMLDYETSDLSRTSPEILTVGFSFNGDRGYVIPYRHPESPFTGAEFREVKRLLTKFFRLRDPSFGSLAAHNIKFEASCTMSEFGVRWSFPVECTQMRAHALNENRLNVGKKGAFSLKGLSIEWLNFLGYLDEDVAPTVAMVKSGRAREVPLADLAEYNAMDCYVQNRIYEFQDYYAGLEGYSDTLRRLGRNLHGPISIFAAWMEYNGIRADKEQLRFFRSTLSPILTRQADIIAELHALPTTIEANALLSSKQKRAKGLRPLFQKKAPWLFSISKKSAKIALFFDVLKLEWDQVTDVTKEPKVNKEFYEAWKGTHEVDLVAEWAALDKLRGTYIEGVYKLLANHPDMRDGRVRGNLNYTLAVSSRSSFSDPNMQNVPARGKFAKTIKNLYTVDEGYVLVCADYSQAEIRWLAEISGDERLLNAYLRAQKAKQEYLKDPTEENKRQFLIEGDFHRQTAAKIFKKKPEDITDLERYRAKEVLFGIIYGMRKFGLSRRLKISVSKAAEYIKTFLDQFPQARDWLFSVEEEGFQQGFVESPIGRRRHMVSNLLLDGMNQRRMTKNLRSHKGYEDRACRNSPIQSIASDMNLLACSKIHEYTYRNKKDWRIVNVVHDSIMAEIPFPEVLEYIQVAEEIMTDPDIFSGFGIRVNVPLEADFTIGKRWGDQLEVALIEKWALSCKECGKVRESAERPRNKRCEECGAKNVSIRILSGQLQKLLRVLDKRHGYAEFWKRAA